MGIESNNKELKHVVPILDQAVIRAMYSNPPAHYARVVALILSDPALMKKWCADGQLFSIRLNKQCSLAL